MNPLDRSSLRIETPEGVVFTLRLASPVARALAWALDAAIVIAVAQALAQASGLFRVFGEDWADAFAAFSYFALSVAYGIVLEWRWRGQTVGKRLLRLRVVDAQGLRLQWTQIVLRNLIRSFDVLPVCYLIGGTACLISRKAQRLGDIAANTIVVREAVLSEPDLDHIAPARYNSLAAFPHLAARLRQRVDPEAVGIAVRAITLRDGYTPRARLELFAELADSFRALVEFPESAVQGLTDEQYVRSAVLAIYGVRRVTAVPGPQTSPIARR